MIQIKRVYEKVQRSDGYRVLVDRLWPRGLKKNEVYYDEWIRELSPSNELRKLFHHDHQKWKDFQSAYKKELAAPEAKEKLKLLKELSKQKNITLLYSAKDETHNNAVVLKQILERKLKH